MEVNMASRKALFVLPCLIMACDHRSLNMTDAGSPDWAQAQLDAGAPDPDWGVIPGDASPPIPLDQQVLPDAMNKTCNTSKDCGEKQYCKGGCIMSGGKMGVCETRPDACPMVLSPVCGCDGKTYGNLCAAHAAGVNVSYSGECNKMCGNDFVYPACPAGEVCDYRACGSSVGTCVNKPSSGDCLDPVHAAVCGCDGKTYGCDPLRLLAGVALAHQGACGDVKVTTDKTSYGWGAPITVSLANSTAASVFLPGCVVYGLQRQEKGGWVDKAPMKVCVWEVPAMEVKTGAMYDEQENTYTGGTFRFKTRYGVGCTAGKPLSGAGCKSFTTVYSNVFTVAPDAKQCGTLGYEYSVSLPAAKVCNLSSNMPQCEMKVDSSLRCGLCTAFVNDIKKLTPLMEEWAAASCNTIDYDCPMVDCMPANKGVCIGNTCMNQ